MVQKHCSGRRQTFERFGRWVDTDDDWSTMDWNFKGAFGGPSSV